MKAKLVGVAASLLIHGMVLFVSFAHPKGENNKAEKKVDAQTFMHVKIIPKLDKQAESPAAHGNGKGAMVLGKMCDANGSTYDGVGLYYQAATGLITQVPEEYPAYRNGVRLGDRVIGNEFTSTDDGYLIFSVERYGQYIYFRIKKEKICFVPDEQFIP